MIATPRRHFKPFIRDWVLVSPQRDITPESVADCLQGVPARHYQSRGSA
jgi:hypothetical protein